MEGVPAKKLFPVVLLGGVGLWLLFGSGDAKAATPDVTPPAPKPPTPPPAPGPGPIPNPTGEKNRKRLVDSTTATPSSFALKYSGDGSRWREVAALNGLTVFDQPLYTYSNAKFDDAGNVIDKGPPDPTPYGYTDKSGSKFSPVSGLSPWMLGQAVIIPDDWKG